MAFMSRGVSAVLLALLLAVSCERGGGSRASPSTPTSSVSVTAASPAAASPTAPSPAPPRPPPSRAEPGGPVPKGMLLVDLSFVNADEGWLLGTAPCKSPPCTSVLHTMDGGRSWGG